VVYVRSCMRLIPSVWSGGGGTASIRGFRSPLGRVPVFVIPPESFGLASRCSVSRSVSNPIVLDTDRVKRHSRKGRKLVRVGQQGSRGDPEYGGQARDDVQGHVCWPTNPLRIGSTFRPAEIIGRNVRQVTQCLLAEVRLLPGRQQVSRKGLPQSPVQSICLCLGHWLVPFHPPSWHSSTHQHYK
jgi:hypothetical protein